MSKFNRPTVPTATGASPVETGVRPVGQTYEGAPGYGRDARSELFLLAVSNMVSERTFYEGAQERDSRYAALVGAAAVADPEWTGRFLVWLRGEANLRSAALVGALEAARAMLEAGLPGSRAMVAAVLQRADEPGEALAYWISHHGRAIPKPVKRAVADAVRRLYTERSLLKYDTARKGFRFADVIELTHPAPADPAQGVLFACALARRHDRGEPVPSALPVLTANAALRRAAEQDPTVLLDPRSLADAAMTWEDALSLAGSTVDKARLWSALVPSMGYMACLRNLRNFDEAGVSDDVAGVVAARLADPDQVARSRQFPFRFLAAYRAARSLRWGHALDRALTASLANVPETTGRTLVLIDRSGSMFDRMSARSGLNRADTAALFGAALAVRNPGRTDLVQFGTGSAAVPIHAGDSLLRVVQERFASLGGTNTAAAVRQWYADHDRVVIVTDEQAHDGDPGQHVPATVPVYTWNLAGYRLGHGPGGLNRHTFAGMTDAAFRMIPLLEAGRDADWPF